MRWIYSAIVALFIVLVVILAVENFQSVTLTFLGVRITVPMVLLVAIVYVLGMVTGSSLWALLRRSIEGSKRRPSPA